VFTSKLYPQELVVGDDFPVHLVEPGEGMSKGLDLSLRGADGYRGVASPFPDTLLVPWDEIPDRARELEESQTRISDILTRQGVKEKNQDGTNHCWAYGPVQACEITRAVQNEPYVALSATSVSGPVKNFRNVGGWGREALAYIIEKGIVPEANWPANRIDRQYLTAENLKIAERFKVTEWLELTPRNIHQKLSCLLRQMPVACGYNWWEHEIVACDVVVKDGKFFGTRERNQWKGWGVNNFVVLSGQKCYADDQIAPLVLVS
jgi:hypothetical protein